MWRILAVLFIFFQIVAFGRAHSLNVAIPHFTFRGGLFEMSGIIQPTEPDETFSVELSNATNTKLGNNSPDIAAIANREARIAQAGNNVDEFIGPFPSWANLKTWYGAVGDGNSDDTQALQTALNDLGKTGKSSVLYLPAGTYKITNQLDLSKARNVAIVGESPDLVTLRWAGADGGTMLRFQNTAYARVQRVTFDGNNTAGNGLWIRWDGKTANFPTTFDFSDNVFKNLQVGIRGGKYPTKDGHQDTAAEVAIQRSKFLGNSSAGILLNDWNTVDWWIRDSLFENNNNGIKGNIGVFHVSDSVFKNSTSGDISARDNFFIGLRNNYSIGSPYFYQTGGPTGSGQIATIQNNTILDATDTAIQIKTPGPVTLLDNTIRNSAGNLKPAVTFGGFSQGNVVSVGNTFSVSNPIKIDSAYNRFFSLDTSVANKSTIADSQPALPPTPKQATAPVIEVDALTGVSIQAAIDRAVRDYSGQRPIVHLPAGNYDVSSTISIPAGSDLRLVGDVGYLAFSGVSRLSWRGAQTGPVLSILGPSHAVVQDIFIFGGSNKQASGIAIQGVDQPGGRIFLDQAQANAFANTGAGLRVKGLDYTTVDAINHGLGGDKGIRVTGGTKSKSGQSTTARVNLFGGSSGSVGTSPSFQVHDGGRLIVRDSWYENGKTRTPILQLSSNNTGTITLDNMRQQYFGNAAGSSPIIAIDGFSGQVTINGIAFTGASVEIKGSNPNTNVLLLNSNFGNQDSFPSVFSNSVTAGQVSFLQNWISTSREQYANQGTVDPDWLRSMLAPLRQEKLADRSLPVPSDVTDLALLRVGVESVSDGFVIMP
jgi:Pectate lyase superfamily protein